MFGNKETIMDEGKEIAINFASKTSDIFFMAPCRHRDNCPGELECNSLDDEEDPIDIPEYFRNEVTEKFNMEFDKFIKEQNKLSEDSVDMKEIRSNLLAKTIKRANCERNLRIEFERLKDSKQKNESKLVKKLVKVATQKAQRQLELQRQLKAITLANKKMEEDAAAEMAILKLNDITVSDVTSRIDKLDIEMRSLKEENAMLIAEKKFLEREFELERTKFDQETSKNETKEATPFYPGIDEESVQSERDDVSVDSAETFDRHKHVEQWKLIQFRVENNRLINELIALRKELSAVTAEEMKIQEMKNTVNSLGEEVSTIAKSIGTRNSKKY